MITVLQLPRSSISVMSWTAPARRSAALAEERPPRPVPTGGDDVKACGRRSWQGADGALRRGLKYLLRYCGLRCVSVQQEEPGNGRKT